MEVDQQRPKTKRNVPIMKLVDSLMVPLRQNEYMQIKSVLCKHEYKLFVIHRHGCLEHIIRGGTRSLIIAYIGKTIVSFVQLLMKKKVKPSAFFRILYEEDTLRFVAFPTLYAIIQKGIVRINILGIMCYFRNNSEEDKKKYSFIAGYAAGFIGLSVLQQKKRSPWALYLLTRSLDTVFLSLQNRGHIKKRKFYYVLFMSKVLFNSQYCKFWLLDMLMVVRLIHWHLR